MRRCSQSRDQGAPNVSLQTPPGGRRGVSAARRSRRTTASILAISILAIGTLTTTSPLQADDRIDARRHFTVGMKLIRQGRFVDGVEQLERAYQIRPHPTVLYNIGKAWFDAEHFDLAIPYLERYLNTDPQDREEATRLLNKARQRRASIARDVATDETSQPSRDPDLTPGRVSSATGGARPPGDDSLEQVTRDLRSVVQRLENVTGTASNSGRQSPQRPSETGVSGSTSSAPGAGVGRVEGPGTPAPGAMNSSGSGATPLPQSAPIAPGATAPLEDPYTLEVITASRYAQRQIESPNAITVISGDDIVRSGAVSLPDVLRRVPGMEVMALNPADVSLGIRGFNNTLSNKVLVLLDGRSVYLDFLGATIWTLLSISPSDIERIEVIRGPGAALYGAGAFSGVVNIITKTPGENSDHPIFTLRTGVPDYTQGSVHLVGRQGGTAFRGSASLDMRERFAIDVDPTREDYTLPAPYPELAARIGRVDLRVDQRFGPQVSLSLSGGTASGQSEFMAVGVLRDFFVNGSYSYLRGDLVLPGGFNIRSFWNHLDVVATPSAIPTGGLDLTSSPISDVIDLEIENYQTFTLGAQHRLNAGVGYRYKTIDWEWLPMKPQESHFSAFLQDEAKWNAFLSTTLSLRVDRHPLLWEQIEAPLLDRLAFSPRAAMVWQLVEDHAVRATVGTAFRTPTFLDSYIEQAIPTSNDGVVVLTEGNQTLLPERIVSLELGYFHQPAQDKYELEGNIFLNRVNQLLTFSAMEPWPSDVPSYDPAGYYYAGTTHPENVDEPHTAIGLELGARVYPLEGLDVYANYALTHIQAGDGSTAETVQSTSPHKLNAGMRLGRGGWSVAGDFHLASSQIWTLRTYDAVGQVVETDVKIPTYTWLNARLARKLEKGIELAIEGRNLLAPLQGPLTPDSSDATADESTADGSTDQGQVVLTSEGVHREHPLGQPIPLSVGVSFTWSLW